MREAVNEFRVTKRVADQEYLPFSDAQDRPAPTVRTRSRRTGQLITSRSTHDLMRPFKPKVHKQGNGLFTREPRGMVQAESAERIDHLHGVKNNRV